jgi:hypothetical protein
MITHQEALIYTMILVSGADREMQDVELKQIGRMVKTLPAFEGYDANNLPTTARECAALLHQDDGFARCVDLVATALTGRLRETGYLLGCEVAAIDRKVHVEEGGLLRLLRLRLQIDDLTAAALERATSARLAGPDAA